MCDEDYWRKEAERLQDIADGFKALKDVYKEERDDARKEAEILRLQCANEATWHVFFRDLAYDGRKQRDEARHIARVLYKFYKRVKRMTTWTSIAQSAWANCCDYVDKAKRELPWL